MKSYLRVVLSLVANVRLIPVSMPCLHQSFSSIFAALFALLLWRPRGYHDNGTWLRRERRSTSILIRGREAARQLLLHVHVMESFEKPSPDVPLSTIGFKNPVKPRQWINRVFSSWATTSSCPPTLIVTFMYFTVWYQILRNLDSFCKMPLKSKTSAKRAKIRFLKISNWFYKKTWNKL